MPVTQKNIMRLRLHLRYLGLLLWVQLFITVPTVQVQAQEIFESEPFGFRAEPSPELSSELTDPFSYQGEPISYRSFRIWPNLTLEQEYTDNILAIEDNTDSDFVTILKPEIEIWNEVGRHDFGLKLNGEFRRHWERQKDDVENYSLAFNGNIEAKRELNIPLKITYRDAHLKRIDQRRSNASQIVESPLNVKFFDVETGVAYKPNRLELKLLGKYEQIRLGNGQLINGDQLNRDNRNVNITEINAEASYDLTNGLSPFIRATYSHEDYINENIGAISRNNDLSALLSGAKFNYKGLLTGFMGAGFESRSYDDPAVQQTTDFSFSGELEWQPTAKTKLNFNASRSTSEDNVLISGVTETLYGLSISHEIMHDVFGRAHLKFENSKFDELNRTDDRTDAGFEVLKIINPRFQMGAEYSFTTRDSSLVGLDLDNNTVMLRLKAAL